MLWAWAIEKSKGIAMKKTYQITASLVTHYSKLIEFDPDNTNFWYRWDIDAKLKGLRWNELGNKRRKKIICSFEESLNDVSIDPESDPDVFEESSDWEEDLIIDEL